MCVSALVQGVSKGCFIDSVIARWKGQAESNLRARKTPAPAAAPAGAKGPRRAHGAAAAPGEACVSLFLQRCPLGLLACVCGAGTPHAGEVSDGSLPLDLTTCCNSFCLLRGALLQSRGMKDVSAGSLFRAGLPVGASHDTRIGKPAWSETHAETAARSQLIS